MPDNSSENNKKAGKKAKIGKKLDTTVKVADIAEDGVEITKGAVELGKKIGPKIGKKLGG